jgi:threonyl-tRNA synthetase
MFFPLKSDVPNHQLASWGTSVAVHPRISQGWKKIRSDITTKWCPAVVFVGDKL